MNEARSISVTTVISSTLWGSVLAVLIAAWIAMSVGDQGLAVMLGFSVNVFTGAAAVFSLRTAEGRTRSLVRSLHGLDGEHAAGQLHSLT